MSAETRPLGCLSFRSWASRSPPPTHLHPDPRATRAAYASSLDADPYEPFPVHSFSAGLPAPPNRVRVVDSGDRSLTPSADPRGRDAGRNLGGSRGNRGRTLRPGISQPSWTAPWARGHDHENVRKIARANAGREPTKAQRRRRIPMSKVRTVGRTAGGESCRLKRAERN